MEYSDFELEIGPGEGYEYPVRVLNSPAGQARETMRFPFGELELENKLQALQIALLRSGGQRRQMLSREQQTVQDFGRALFDALLTGEVRTRYDISLRDATLQGRGLRLKLRINTPEMATLPWEFLYDPRQAEYIALSHDTPIVRYLELSQYIQPLTIDPPLCILGMVASPRDLGTLNIDVEKQRVELALCNLQKAGLVELTWLEGQTWQDLQRALRQGNWHIFHFIGHGGFDHARDEGYIALADEDGATHRFSATQLARLLANARDNLLRLVVLNACESAAGSARDLFSSTAAILVRRGLPAVLAMQYAITDRAAIIFSQTFYESLMDGLPVDTAVVEARVAISLAIDNTVEWGTPVLHMRSPDGVLFKLAAPHTSVTVPEPRHPEPVPEEQPEKRVTSAPEPQPDFSDPATYPELHPKPGPVLADVNAYNSRGNDYYEAQDYLAALADFNSAIELSPEYTVALFNRGSTYYMLKRPDKALADYTRVIELSPEDGVAYFSRGDTYLALQQYDAALADFARAIELGPEDALVYYGMGRAHALQGHSAEACTWLEKAIALDEEYRSIAHTDPDFALVRDAPCFQALVALDR